MTGKRLHVPQAAARHCSTVSPRLSMKYAALMLRTTEGGTMKHRVYGVAFVAFLAIAPPISAQTKATPPTATAPSINMPAPSPPQAASEKATTTPAPAATENAAAAPKAKRPKRQARRA